MSSHQETEERVGSVNPSMYIENIVQSIGIIISEIKCVYPITIT